MALVTYHRGTEVLWIMLAVLLQGLVGGMTFSSSGGQQTDPNQDLQSAMAMSQLVLAQQAQFFRELINITKYRVDSCCNGNAFKSDLGDIPPAATAMCPYPFVHVVGECFYINPTSLAWHSARHHCRGMGGDLAAPKNLYALRALIVDQRGPRAMWIGGTDKGLDGGWQWVNGHRVDESDWANKSKRSKRPVEHCLTIRRDRHPVLDDSPCHNALRFVCQYKPDEQFLSEIHLPLPVK